MIKIEVIIRFLRLKLGNFRPFTFLIENPKSIKVGDNVTIDSNTVIIGGGEFSINILKGKLGNRELMGATDPTKAEEGNRGPCFKPPERTYTIRNCKKNGSWFR